MLAAAWTVASCSAEPTSSATASPTGPRTFHVEFPAFERVAALPVEIRDDTGLVVAVARAAKPLGGDPVGVSVDPADSRTVLVGWLSGACSVSSTIQLTTLGARLRISAGTADAPGPCLMIGYVRVVAIQFSEPVDAAKIDFLGG